MIHETCFANIHIFAVDIITCIGHRHPYHSQFLCLLIRQVRTLFLYLLAEELAINIYFSGIIKIGQLQKDNREQKHSVFARGCVEKNNKKQRAWKQF